MFSLKVPEMKSFSSVFSQVGEEEDGLAHYCLTSTVMLALTSENRASGTFSLSGAITRQVRFLIPLILVSFLAGERCVHS